MSLIYSNIPELEGTDTEITLANLSELEVELEKLFEKRIAHLCELARAIVKDGVDSDLVKSIILSVRSDGEIDSDRVSSFNAKEIGELFSKISLIERLILFKEVFGDMPGDFFESGESIALPLPEAKDRVAYVKNSYNDLAFGGFSDIIKDSKASYFDNTVDVCESVLSGKCQYCILPIETMRDGRLLSFYKAIINYNMKICAEYDLINADGAGYTRYALLSTSLEPNNKLKKTKNNSKYLEITYLDENVSFGEILVSAEYFGLRLESVDTLVINEISEKKRFCAVFLARGADIEAFITYLAVDYPDVSIVGLYQRI